MRPSVQLLSYLPSTFPSPFPSSFPFPIFLALPLFLPLPFLSLLPFSSAFPSYMCKKTYQFTTVCKDDVMISVLYKKTAKIIWVTLDGAMHMASLQADFSW